VVNLADSPGWRDRPLAAMMRAMTASQPSRPAPKTATELLGVPDEPKNARDRILQTSIDLFYRHGFHAIGLDRILAEVGVTKTTFYNHFESKDELVVEAIRTRDRWERGAWAGAVAKLAGDDPRAQLLAMFDVLDVWFHDPDFIGCMFINTAAEFPNPNDPAHRAAAEHKVAARDDIRDMAKAAGATQPEVFADLYTTVLEGTLILRQVHGRDEAARISRPVIERLIAEHIDRA
jgi:AcrR family transcriptional regulator